MDPSSRKAQSERIKRLAKEAGFVKKGGSVNKAALARAAGINPSRLTDLEKQRRSLSKPVAKALGAVLGVSLGFIYFGEAPEWQTPPLRFPLVGQVGPDGLVISDDMGSLSLHLGLLRIEGPWFDPRIPAGGMALVQVVEEMPEDGAMAIIVTKAGEVGGGLVRRHSSEVELCPLSALHGQSVVVTKAQTKRIIHVKGAWYG